VIPFLPAPFRLFFHFLFEVASIIVYGFYHYNLNICKHVYSEHNHIYLLFGRFYFHFSRKSCLFRSFFQESVHTSIIFYNSIRKNFVKEFTFLQRGGCVFSLPDFSCCIFLLAFSTQKKDADTFQKISASFFHRCTCLFPVLSISLFFGWIFLSVPARYGFSVHPPSLLHSKATVPP